MNDDTTQLDFQEEGTEANNTADYGDADNVYPFGVDPAWHIAGNEVKAISDFELNEGTICFCLFFFSTFSPTLLVLTALCCATQQHIYYM